MNIRLSMPEDTYQSVYRKMASGKWILITGELPAISRLEESIYTPGTARNADLEAVHGFRAYFFLGRKTQDLRRALTLERDDDAWDSLFALRISGLGGDHFNAETKHFRNTADRDLLLESLVKRLVDVLEHGGEPA